MSSDDIGDEYGGLIDDVKTAAHWLPILKLVKKLEDAKDIVEQTKAAQEIVAFAIRTALHKDPYKARAFLLFALACETIETDPRWRKVVEGML